MNGSFDMHEVKTEPSFSVYVEDIVAFGDFGDARKTTISIDKPGPGSTICFTNNTMRRFWTGIYKVSVIQVSEIKGPSEH